MPVHTLDTSALSELAKPGSALARHRLVAEVDAGRIVVLVTWPLMWEIVGARAVDDAHYRAMVEVLLRITGGQVMLMERSRRERELREPAALSRSRGSSTTSIGSRRHSSPRRSTLAAAKERGARAGSAVRRGGASRRPGRGLNESERQRAMARGEEVDEVGAAWHRALALANRREEYALELAESYAVDRMLKDAASAGIDVTNLSPRDLPTFWSSALIHVARIRAVIIGGTSPVGRSSTGQVDLLHLEEAASYADVFVTCDRALRSFATTVRGLRCEVLPSTTGRGESSHECEHVGRGRRTRKASSRASASPRRRFRRPASGLPTSGWGATTHPTSWR